MSETNGNSAALSNNKLAEIRRIQMEERRKSILKQQGQINNIMQARRERINSIARGEGSTYQNSAMRNDNDLDIIDRSELLGGNNSSVNQGQVQPQIQTTLNTNNNSFMDFFDENYYLDNSRTSKKLVSEKVKSACI